MVCFMEKNRMGVTQMGETLSTAPSNTRYQSQTRKGLKE